MIVPYGSSTRYIYQHLNLGWRLANLPHIEQGVEVGNFPHIEQGEGRNDGATWHEGCRVQYLLWPLSQTSRCEAGGAGNCSPGLSESFLWYLHEKLAITTLMGMARRWWGSFVSRGRDWTYAKIRTDV